MVTEDTVFSNVKSGPTIRYKEGVNPNTCDVQWYPLGSPYGDEYLVTLRVGATDEISIRKGKDV